MNNTSIILLITAALLAGCEAKTRSSVTTTESSETVETNAGPTENVTARKPTEAYFIDLTKEPDVLVAQNDLVVKLRTSGVSLSGNAPENATSSGKTDGIYLVIDEDEEAKFSGQTLRISFIARGEDGASLKVAYSTADVGNSGWNTFLLSPNFQTYSFEYTVPQMKEGGKDFLGLIPTGSNVELKSLTFTPFN